MNIKQHEAARTWFEENYENAKIISHRWFVGCIAALLTSVLLAITLLVAFPLKTLVPLIVHQNTITGEIWVTHPNTPFVPENDAQVQSDIVRYITSRESYSAADLNQRFQQVLLLTADKLRKDYADTESNANPNSPVSQLGAEGSRTVHIEDIVFIDKAGLQELRHFKEASQNLAKVDFITSTTDKTGNTINQAWVATIGWIYNGKEILMSRSDKSTFFGKAAEAGGHIAKDLAAHTAGEIVVKAATGLGSVASGVTVGIFTATPLGKGDTPSERKMQADMERGARAAETLHQAAAKEREEASKERKFTAR